MKPRLAAVQKINAAAREGERQISDLQRMNLLGTQYQLELGRPAHEAGLQSSLKMIYDST